MAKRGTVPDPLENFEARSNWLVIDKIEGGMTAGGIALPEDHEGSMPCGYVVAVGEGKVTDYGELLVPEAKLGDLVHVYSTAHAIEIGHEKFLVARGDMVIGVELANAC